MFLYHFLSLSTNKLNLFLLNPANLHPPPTTIIKKKKNLKKISHQNPLATKPIQPPPQPQQSPPLPPSPTPITTTPTTQITNSNPLPHHRHQPKKEQEKT